MSEKSVFYVGGKLSAGFTEKLKTELQSTGTIHQIAPGVFNRRGGLAALIGQAKTIHVCVDKSSVPLSEIKIAIANKLSFFVADKTKKGKGAIVHSSEFASSNFN